MICANIKEVQQRISEAAERCGRNPEEIRLVAVSKRQGIEKIRRAFQCDQTLFGENYLQEAAEKTSRLDPSISWHCIGHLQSNKARQAAELFQVIETVDRLKIARALNTHAGLLCKQLDIFIQVNIGLETQKSGIEPRAAEQLIRQCREFEHLRVRGLMTIPPFSLHAEDSRPYFKALKNLSVQFTKNGLFSETSPELSMGMSGDFTIAVEEGATLVRVGTAIFGERT